MRLVDATVLDFNEFRKSNGKFWNSNTLFVVVKSSSVNRNAFDPPDTLIGDWPGLTWIKNSPEDVCYMRKWKNGF